MNLRNVPCTKFLQYFSIKRTESESYSPTFATMAMLGYLTVLLYVMTINLKLNIKLKPSLKHSVEEIHTPFKYYED